MDGRVEKVLTCCHEAGPFYAHLVNGVWVRSTPIRPNLPVGHSAYALRNRIMSLDRIRYPMKRVGFDPKGERNPGDRGRSRYERIPWQEALDIVSGEIKRVSETYGPSAILHSPIEHQWPGGLHRATDWAHRFFSILGGCSRLVGDTSFTGWKPGGTLVWGFTSLATNNAQDILENTKLLIHWASDVAVKRYSTYRQNLWMRRFREAGIRQIVVDPYLNDTAAIYGDEWIPILPETDEALMAAIAHVWITERLHDEEFLQTHTVGFERFIDYVLGRSDAEPKTPSWAARICSVDEGTIRELAHEWASKPTYVLCDYGGANRRYGAAEWIRMVVTMQALLGNIGRPGRGLGRLSFEVRGRDQKGIPDVVPSVVRPYSQFVRHAQFAEAILGSSSRWTTVSIPQGEVREVKYPAEGCSRIKLVAFLSENGWILNQIPGTCDHVRALQSPEIEFTYCHAAWWHSAPKFADVILPVRHIGERDDIMQWENYTVYSHTIVEPEGEPKNDLDILMELGKRLGLGDELTLGKSTEGLLREIYQGLGLPMGFEEFREKGFYKYPEPEDAPEIIEALEGFYLDPERNRLNTPSGKIEIFSQRVTDFFGEDDSAAALFPKYLASPERAEALPKYPLFVTSPHPKLGRHSQWQNLSWHRDEYQMNINGYSVVRMSPADAGRRGIRTGDVVRIYNDRGSIFCTAYLTERIMPGVIRVPEGGWYTPMIPGLPEASDVGGNPNLLISGRQPEPLCDGMTNGARVEVERWGE